jgi:membrane protein insertase Oxa1/YidC/SpoIIIJ
MEIKSVFNKYYLYAGSGWQLDLFTMLLWIIMRLFQTIDAHFGVWFSVSLGSVLGGVPIIMISSNYSSSIVGCHFRNG